MEGTKGSRVRKKKKKRKQGQGYYGSLVDKWMVALGNHSVCVDRIGSRDHSGGT